MDSLNLKDKKNSTEFQYLYRQERHNDCCDIFTTLDRYRTIDRMMTKNGWKRLSHGHIQDTLLSIKLWEETGSEYTIRVTYYKEKDDYKSQCEMERERINAWRKVHNLPLSNPHEKKSI